MNSSKVTLLIFAAALLVLNGCSTRGKGVYRNTRAVSNSYSTDTKKYSHPTMKPYVRRGVKYYPTVVSVGDSFVGNASWYGPKFHGNLTSNGEKYNMYAMTAAHKTLPMNTIVRVTNKRNHLSTVVRINDRGPFVSGRIIDLSKKAAQEIKMIGSGTAPVTVEVLGFETKGKRSIPTKREMKRAPQKQEIGNFALQIASFTQIKGALLTQEKYDNTDGYKTLIKDVMVDNQRLFKVILTGFKSEQEARDYKKTSQFKNAFILRED